MLSRARFSAALSAVILATMLLVAGSGLAQDNATATELHPSRTAMSLDMSMSADAPGPNATATPQADGEPFSLVLGSGTAGSVASGCAPPAGQPQETAIADWVSEPLFEFPTSVFGTIEIVLPLSAETGAALAAGTVELTLALNADGVHPLGAASWQFSPGATGVQFPTAANFSMELSAEHGAINPAQGLVFTLSARCDQPANFAIGFGNSPLPTISYVYGDPSDPDSDGDGLPDALDDDDDGDGASDQIEATYGTSPTDPTSSPLVDGDGDGFTLQQEVDNSTSDTDAADFPGAGGFPLGIILLILLAIIVVGAAVFGAMLVVNRGLKLVVSHDGFQAIDQGEEAVYEITLESTSKKDDEVPYVLSLKGVPEDWSATLSPDRLVLRGGDETVAEIVTLKVKPPADAEFEQEAQIAIAATPTDEEGNTSALKPGASTKTKTIVNIGVTPPEGEEKAKGAALGGLAGRFKKKDKGDDDDDGDADAADGEAPEADAAEEEAPKKKKRALGKLKKKKKAEAEDDAAEEPAPDAPEDEAAAAPAPGAGTNGKPKLAMGKMQHTPDDFSAGDAVTTVVPVMNKGDGGVQGLRLKLFVNDEEVDDHVVDLDAGAKTEVTFEWTAKPDENRVRVKGEIPKRS